MNTQIMKNKIKKNMNKIKKSREMDVIDEMLICEAIKYLSADTPCVIFMLFKPLM